MSHTKRVPCPPDCNIAATHAHYEQTFKMNFEPAPQCPNCHSENIAKVKGCLRCLQCGFKEDCNGW